LISRNCVFSLHSSKCRAAGPTRNDSSQTNGPLFWGPSWQKRSSFSTSSGELLAFWLPLLPLLLLLLMLVLVLVSCSEPAGELYEFCQRDNFLKARAEVMEKRLAKEKSQRLGRTVCGHCGNHLSVRVFFLSPL